MKLKVILLPESEGGYSVAIPALPGCVSCGETVEEAMANIREAAEGMLEAMQGRNPFEPLDTCKALERRGWTFDRIRGSHHIYVSPDGRRSVPVPVHGNKTLPPGTQHVIM